MEKGKQPILNAKDQDRNQTNRRCQYVKLHESMGFTIQLRELQGACRKDQDAFSQEEGPYGEVAENR